MKQDFLSAQGQCHGQVGGQAQADSFPFKYLFLPLSVPRTIAPEGCAEACGACT